MLSEVGDLLDAIPPCDLLGDARALLLAAPSSPTPEALAASARAACWDVLHQGDWRAVPLAARSLYGLAACVEASCMHARGARAEALRTIDLALMLGAPARLDALSHRLLAVIRGGAGMACAQETSQPLPRLLPELLEPIAAREEAHASERAREEAARRGGRSSLSARDAPAWRRRRRRRR